MHVCGREKERGKIRGRGKENGRENTLVPGVGDCARGARGARDGAKVTAKQAAVRRTKRARGWPKKRTAASIHWSPSGPSGDARGKIKKKAPGTTGKEGRPSGRRRWWTGAGGVAKNLRAKSAHEMKRNSEERAGRVRGWRGIYERRRPNRFSFFLFFFFFFLRPSGYRCLSLFFSLISDVARERATQEFHATSGVQQRVREPSEFAPPSVSPRGWRDDVYIFQDIGNILRHVARPRTNCANRHKYGLRVIEREPGIRALK